MTSYVYLTIKYAHKNNQSTQQNENIKKIFQTKNFRTLAKTHSNFFRGQPGRARLTTGSFRRRLVHPVRILLRNIIWTLLRNSVDLLRERLQVVKLGQQGQLVIFAQRFFRGIRFGGFVYLFFDCLAPLNAEVGHFEELLWRRSARYFGLFWLKFWLITFLFIFGFNFISYTFMILWNHLSFLQMVWNTFLNFKNY